MPPSFQRNPFQHDSRYSIPSPVPYPGNPETIPTVLSRTCYSIHPCDRLAVLTTSIPLGIPQEGAGYACPRRGRHRRRAFFSWIHKVFHHEYRLKATNIGYRLEPRCLPLHFLDIWHLERAFHHVIAHHDRRKHAIELQRRTIIGQERTHLLDHHHWRNLPRLRPVHGLCHGQVSRWEQARQRAEADCRDALAI